MVEVPDKSRDLADPALQARDLFYTSSDGLRLHARDHGDPLHPWLPVVCLPGLARTARDFEELASFLSTQQLRPRRVVAFDYRGRGQSDRDRDIRNYNPVTEMNDVLDGMAALGLNRAFIIGTSRGGIIAMLMGVARPATVAGIVLNDIGPAIEPIGLARIKTYVAGTPLPDDWSDAIRILKRLHGSRFTGLDEEGWLAFARMTYRDENGRPIPDHDPSLGRTLDGVEFDEAVPTLWKEFLSLAHCPMLAIRGENSDLLTSETVAAMAEAHPGLESLAVAGEGHPPLLRGAELLQRISAFIMAAEDAAPAEASLPRPEPTFDLDAPKESAIVE